MHGAKSRFRKRGKKGVLHVILIIIQCLREFESFVSHHVQVDFVMMILKYGG